MTTHRDKILISMKVVSGLGPDAESTHRWQVLTIGGGRVIDIRGYEEESEARQAAGLAGN